MRAGLSASTVPSVAVGRRAGPKQVPRSMPDGVSGGGQCPETSRRRPVLPLCLGILAAVCSPHVGPAQLTAHFKAQQIDYDSGAGDCDVCLFCTPVCELYFAMGIWSAGIQRGSTHYFPAGCSTLDHDDGVLNFTDEEISEDLPDLTTSARFYFAVYDEDPLDEDDLLGTHYSANRSTPATNQTDNSNNSAPGGFSIVACDGGSLDFDSVAGRFGLTYSVRFTDVTGPSSPGTPMHSDSTASTGWDDDTTLNFSWSAASDPHSGVSSQQVQLRKDGVTLGTTTVGTSTSITVCSGCTVSRAIVDGSQYAVRVRARNGDPIDLSPETDSAYSPWSSNVTVDLTAPTTSITAPAANSWQNSDFQVTVQDSDPNLDTCEYAVMTNGLAPTGSDWTARPCSTAVIVSVGSTPSDDCSLEGAGPTNVCRFYSRVVDGPGRSASTNRTFAIDYTADPVSPVTALTEPGGSSILSGEWTMDFTPYLSWPAPASVAPILGYSWSIDVAADCATDTAGTALDFATGPLADGVHPFEVRTVDAADNCATASPFDLRVDATSDAIPELDAFTEPGGTQIFSGEPQSDDTPYMEWTAISSTSPAAGYGYGLGDTEDCTVDTGNTFTFVGPLPEGSHTFWVRGIDSAGNCGPVSIFDIVVDPCPLLHLTGDTVLGLRQEQACWILVGPNYVVDPAGDLTLRSGTIVVFGHDFSVGIGGSLTVIIDPSLIP